MRNSKPALKALALTVMIAFGMMRLGAAGAQAAKLPDLSTVGSYLVNGGVPSGNPFLGEQLGPGYLLVAARDLKIECAGGTVSSGVINNSTDASATITFTGCVANNHAGTPLKGCAFKELETIKASFLALPVLHGGKVFILFEPREGTQFTSITFKPGTTCTLPLNNPVTGSVVAEVKGELEATTQSLGFSPTVQLLNGHVLKYGALSNTAYLVAEADGTVVALNLGIH